MCSKARSCKAFGRKRRNKRPPLQGGQCKSTLDFLYAQKAQGFFSVGSRGKGETGKYKKESQVSHRKQGEMPLKRREGKIECFFVDL